MGAGINDFNHYHEESCNRYMSIARTPELNFMQDNSRIKGPKPFAAHKVEPQNPASAPILYANRDKLQKGVYWVLNHDMAVL